MLFVAKMETKVEALEQEDTRVYIITAGLQRKASSIGLTGWFARHNTIATNSGARKSEPATGGVGVRP